MPSFSSQRRLPTHCGSLPVAHAMRAGSAVLQAAAPLMRALAQSRQINVGLAAADRDEMVYLESIRYSRRAAFRNVVSGQRVPMELTSLGRAYLAAAPAGRYRLLEPIFKKRNGRHWPEVKKAIEASMESMKSKGYCWASWQPEVLALATAYVCGIVLLCRRPDWSRTLGLLAPVGRMALTNYLGQSVVCILIFYGIGLGGYGRVGPAAILAIAVAVFGAQSAFSAWWLRRFRYGPAEWAWRSLTYGRRQPFRLA